VRRLRGMARPVYEARTDSGDRLLFTVIRSASAEQPERLVSHLQVWDLVEHDDVTRKARRNRSPEAEFLELEALEEFAIDEPPADPAATFDDVSPAAGADPLLSFLLSAPAVPDVAADEGLVGAVRWYLLDASALGDEVEFQRRMDGAEGELELKLTGEQYEVLRAPGPVLLAGSAGSGKTVIAVHRLAAEAGHRAAGAARERALYLSASPALAAHARDLYRGLVAARGGDPDLDPPDFFSFEDLYRSLVPADLRRQQALPMDEIRFEGWFRRAGRPLDPALVWEELRSILKGSCLAHDRPMLDERAYFDLGRKRAPLFVHERPEIYRIALRYQEWLAEEGRSDQVDLCRRALAELRRARTRPYGTVICDEVQDLTEIEVALVFALSVRTDGTGVLLAGDTQQIVNPSGFRWAEVRRLVANRERRREAPALHRLRRNFRSVRPLTELANAVLLLRREVFGRSEEDEPEEGMAAGPVPVLLAGEEAAVLAAAREVLELGPRTAVLAGSAEEAANLRERLGTARVFTVREVKGLEFDSLLLWRLLAPDRDLVERFLRGNLAGPEPSLVREVRFKRLLQHLYVAVTRARRHLAIYEGPAPHPFWTLPRFGGLLEAGEAETLPRLFRPTASPADWAAEGDYYFARERFRQAAECYRRAGLSERENLAFARFDESREDWGKALERWRGVGTPEAAERQARLLERLGRLAEALPLYRLSGRAEEARCCELRLLEQRRDWPAAGRGWEDLGRHGDAARCYQRAGLSERALELYSRAGEWLEVARLEGGRPEGSELLLARVRQLAEDEAWGEAADLARARLAVLQPRLPKVPWFLANGPERVAWEESAALLSLDHRCRALNAEREGRFSLATRLWRRAGEPERAAAARRRAIAALPDRLRTGRAWAAATDAGDDLPSGHAGEESDGDTQI